MLIALDRNKNRVLATETEKSDFPFYCPDCTFGLGLRKGAKKIHHFYHLIKINCSHEGESLAHMEHKYELYKRFKQIYFKTDMEVSLDDCRADVYVPERRLALEIQRSSLTSKELFERTTKYQKKGIYVYWIFLEQDFKFMDDRIKIKEMHKAALKLYKGKLYVYNKDKNFVWELILGSLSVERYNDYTGGTYDYTYKNSKKIISRTRIFQRELSQGLILDIEGGPSQ